MQCLLYYKVATGADDPRCTHLMLTMPMTVYVSLHVRMCAKVRMQ